MTNLFDRGDALGPGKVVHVRDHHAGEKLGRDVVIDIECDIWIPAARPDVVREDNVGRLRTKLVLQGANIPYSLGAEQALHGASWSCPTRQAAMRLAGARVEEAMSYRRFRLM